MARQIFEAHFAYANEFNYTGYVKILNNIRQYGYNNLKHIKGLAEKYFELSGKKVNSKEEYEKRVDLMNELSYYGLVKVNIDEKEDKLKFDFVDEIALEEFLHFYDKIDSQVRQKNSYILFEDKIAKSITLDKDGRITKVNFPKFVDELNKVKDKNTEYVDFVNAFTQAIENYQNKTLYGYAKQICDFREKNISLFMKFVQENDIKPDNWELADGFIRMMQQTKDLIDMGIYFPWKVNELDQQWTYRGKNVNMAFNIAEKRSISGTVKNNTSK